VVQIGTLASGFILALALAGSAHATTVSYSCDDGTTLTAVFSPPDALPGSVELAYADSSRTIKLPQVLSADGGRYADDNTEFWIKGRDARLTRARATTACKSG
jgi:membrane-bound inhibitor of C-type lysozyme